jgi:hypothetical protein
VIAQPVAAGSAIVVLVVGIVVEATGHHRATRSAIAAANASASSTPHANAHRRRRARSSVPARR